MANEGIEKHAHGQSIFVVVNLFEARAADFKLSASSGPVPHIPLIERNVDRLGIHPATLRRLDQPFHNFDAMIDVRSEERRVGKECRL